MGAPEGWGAGECGCAVATTGEKRSSIPNGDGVARGCAPPPAFKPKYFLINGVANVATQGHADVAIEAKRGEQVLLRLMNAGFSLVKVQLHGLAANIIAVDGNTLGGSERPWTRSQPEK